MLLAALLHGWASRPLLLRRSTLPSVGSGTVRTNGGGGVVVQVHRPWRILLRLGAICQGASSPLPHSSLSLQAALQHSTCALCPQPLQPLMRASCLSSPRPAPGATRGQPASPRARCPGSADRAWRRGRCLRTPRSAGAGSDGRPRWVRAGGAGQVRAAASRPRGCQGPGVGAATALLLQACHALGLRCRCARLRQRQSCAQSCSRQCELCTGALVGARAAVLIDRWTGALLDGRGGGACLESSSEVGMMMRKPGPAHSTTSLGQKPD